MAVPIIIEYHLIGPTDTNLRQFVGVSAVIISSDGTSVKVQVSSDPNDVLTLNDYMASIGYAVGAAPPISYTPANPADWAAPPPDNIKDAIDRIAARLVAVGLLPIP